MVENREVMASNIRYYMDLNHVNATDVCKALGFKQNTFSDWINAKTYPRIDRIEKLAAYFGVSKSALVEERYYQDEKTGKAAQEVFDDPSLRMLFDAAKDSKPENILLAAEMLKRFKETNPNG